MPRVLWLFAVFLALGSQAARADCRDDVSILEHRLAAAPNQKAANIGKAKKELERAEDPAAGEVVCDNALARAWQAYRTKPVEEAAQPQD